MKIYHKIIIYWVSILLIDIETMNTLIVPSKAKGMLFIVDSNILLQIGQIRKYFDIWVS